MDECWVVIASCGGDNHLDEMDVYGPFTKDGAKLWARQQNKKSSWYHVAHLLQESATV